MTFIITRWYECGGRVEFYAIKRLREGSLNNLYKVKSQAEGKGQNGLEHVHNKAGRNAVSAADDT
jgi:hypothetical protein